MVAQDTTISDEGALTNFPLTMATTKVGTLKEFYPESESVKVSQECVQLYFEVNEVPEDKQVPILLSSNVSSWYTLISDLLAPAMQKSKTLTEITAVLWKHFEPKKRGHCRKLSLPQV